MLNLLRPPTYSIVGGGGGAGGGSAVIVTGTATLTNTGNITGGGGGTGAFANDAANGLDAYTHLSDNGGGGAGGHGIRADSAVSLTIINSGNITGGEAGYNAVAGQAASGAAIYGQNITLTTTAGTIEGGNGSYSGVGINLTGGSNTLNIQGGTVTNYYGTAIVAQGGTNIFNISGGSVTNNYVGYGLQVNGGTNTLNVTGGTLGTVYLGGGATTLEGTHYSNSMTLAHGATAEVTVPGGNVSGITSFDNHGGLTIDAGQSLTAGAFTNESDGTLNLASGAQLISSNLNLIAGSTITGAGLLSSGSNALNFTSGSVSAGLGGTGGLDKTGAGTLTLTGANSYTGGTTIGGGTLAIASGALGGGDVHMAQGTAIAFTGSSFTTGNNFYITGDPIFNVASGTTQTVSGVIADDSGTPGVVEKTGAGELILSGINTYSGGTTISAGKLTVGVNSVLDGMGGITSSAIGTGALTLDGGTLSANAFRTIYNSVLVTSNGGTIDSGANAFEIDGDITDSATPGTLTISGSAGGAVNLDGTNSYSAATLINAGATLTPYFAQALSANSDFTVNGTLNIRDVGSAVTIKSLAGSGTVTNTLAGNEILAIATAMGETATFNGNITDYGGGNPHVGIAIDGQGTEIFAGSGDNYSGGNTLTSGTLGVGASGALGTGTVTFNGGSLAAESDATLGNNFFVNSIGATVDANQHNLSLGVFADGTGVTSGTELTFASTGGAGSIILTGDSSGYSGSVTINSGATLVQGGSAILPGGAYTVNGTLQVGFSGAIGALTGNGVVETIGDSSIGSSGTVATTVASGSATFSGTLRDNGSDPLSLEKHGAGALILTGNNTFTGGTALEAGTLVAGSSTALGDSSSDVTLYGGRLSYANGITLANTLVVEGAAALNVAGSDVATQSGGFTQYGGGGPFTLEKTGTGTLKLTSGTNGTGDAFLLTAGTLEAGSAGALGTGQINFNGGTLKVDGAYTLSNTILVMSGGTFDTNGFASELTGDISNDSSGGALAIIGTGSVKISGINNLSGGTDIGTGATLEVAGASGLGGGDVTMAAGSTVHFTTTSGTFTGNFQLDGAATLNVASGISDALSGIISDAGGTPGVLTKQGAGILVLTNANTYSGGTMLTRGTLEADNDAALGTGALTLDGGTLTSATGVTLANTIAITSNGGTIAPDADTITLNGIISGSGPLSLSGTGSVALNGANTYTGTTTIGGDVVALAGTATAFGNGSNSIVLDGGTLSISSGSVFTIANPIQITDNNGTILGNSGTLTLTGAISDALGDHGALTLGANGSSDTSSIILSGNNTYTGGTTIAGGKVVAGSNTAFGDSSGSVTANAGTTIGYANGVILANSVILAGDGVTFNVASGGAQQAGAILESGGSRALTKTGNGILALSGGANYSGSTNINGGTLEISTVTSAVATSDYAIATGASLSIDSGLGNVYIGSLAGAGTVVAGGGSNLYVGGTIGSPTPNASNTIFSGAITAPELAYDGAGTLTLTGTGSSVDELVVCACVTSGGIALSGGSMTSSTGFLVESGTLTIENGEFATIGDLGISGGAALITGSGTAVTSSAGTEINSTGAAAAALTIADSASLATTGLASVAAAANGDGAASVTVTGAGSIWNVGTLNIGGGSTSQVGSVTVADGGELTTSNPISLVQGSTLNIGNGAAAGIVDAPSITGTSSDQVAANFTGNSTLSAVLTGDLFLTKRGSGTLILTGANDYTGATTITAGTVQIGDGGTGATIGAAAIANNGTLAFNIATPTTLANTVTGTGGVSQLGSGALTIAAAKTYTGVTSIASGSTLLLTGAGDISASSEIAANGTFDVSGATPATVSITSLSGDGTVLIGAKTFTITAGHGTFSGDITDNGAGGSISVTGDEKLTGTHIFSGGLDVGAGTLVVTDAASLGTGTVSFKADSVIKFTTGGTFTNNANFALGAPVFDTAGSTVTWSGQLTGPGDLGVTGAGTLILTNATNSYAGGTEVYGGTTLRVDADGELGTPATLQLGDATTKGTLQFSGAFNLNSARAITLLAGGGVIDTQANNTTISQGITGTGGLGKAGAGILTLSGASTYTGPTTISAGTLAVTGSIASPVTVASGATLTGTGTTGAATVASGGTIAPAAGTLHLNGGLTLASGSTTAISVTPATSGQIAATGAVSLNGTLAITQGPGTYANGTDLKLITGSSLSGTFANVTGATFAGVNSSLVYSATAVDLKIGTGTGTSTSTSFSFGTYGATPNQIAAGNAIAAGSSSGALYTALGGLVSTNTAGVPVALGQIAGEIHASIRSAAIEDGRIIRDIILDHLTKTADGVVVWGSGFGGYGSIAGSGNAASLHHSGAGFIAGADIPVADGLRLGLAGAYSSNAASVAGHVSSASGNSGHVIAYGAWSNDLFDLKLGGDYGWGTARVTRTVTALTQTDSDRQDQRISQVFGDAGYRISSDAATVEPYADIAHVEATSGAFAETGGNTALSGAAKTSAETYSTLGIRASLADIADITPRIDLGWQHAFNHVTPGQVVTLQNAAQSFTVLGVPLGTDAAMVQAGFDVALTPDAILSLGYDGSFAGRVQNSAVRGGLTWNF